MGAFEGHQTFSSFTKHFELWKFRKIIWALKAYRFLNFESFLNLTRLFNEIFLNWSLKLHQNSPETLVHEIFNRTRWSDSDSVFVGNCRSIDASVLCLEHVDEVANIVRNRPEDKLALFITARQWTNDIGQPPDVVNGNFCKSNENKR